MSFKYRCLQCEDPCVLEIAMEANSKPTVCPWDNNEVEWEEYPATKPEEIRFQEFPK